MSDSESFEDTFQHHKIMRELTSKHNATVVIERLSEHPNE